MFFEINNTVQDTNKLLRKRLLIKKNIQRILEEQPLLQRINKEEYYCEESMQIIKIKTQNIEEYTNNNFTL
ncbi:hypothetical protein KO361_01010 [Candidatus Woesearchaeota archaeon]|nr:hypothetical protein [Candidatus Woesearchaeota archaeon]